MMNKIMNMRIQTLLAIVTLTILSCTRQKPVSEPPEEKPSPVIDRTAFAKGADISWSTELNSKGYKFHNAQGHEMELTRLMRQIGMNSIRLRVWVNPDNGWNGEADVINKALIAEKLGMRIMIDFFYSDSWADPSHQIIPHAWADYDLDKMKKAVYSHTEELLSKLKTVGVQVEWVQVGNETTNGMLWPMGELGTIPPPEGHEASSNPRNYAELTTSGYEAVKSVYPEAKVIVQLDRGDDAVRFDKVFDWLKEYGGKYDLIGMSFYPKYSPPFSQESPIEWRESTDACLANIKRLNEKYGCKVIVCETGMPCDDPQTAYEMLSYFIKNTNATGVCEGVFYWEPAAEKSNTDYTLGAFENGTPTAALDAFTEN